MLVAIMVVGCSNVERPTPDGGNTNGNGNKEEEKPEVTAPANSFKWDFDDLDGWVYAHQDTATVDQWSLQNGSLVLSTRAGSYDRTKVYTLQNDFTTGDYTWRINVPNIAAGDQVSVAGFIYQDDQHEIDFEIGYGSAKVREEYGIPSGSMVACMTNQDFPFSSTYTAIKPGWHTFTIRLELKNGFYVAHWIIDDEEKKSLDLDFDADDAKFRIQCSVENLLFIGDHVSSKDYSAKFDYASFSGDVKGTYKAPTGLEDMSFSVSGGASLKSGQSVSLFDLLGNREFQLSSDAGRISGKAYSTGVYNVLYPYDANASLNGSIITTRIPDSVVAVTDASELKVLAAAVVKDGSVSLEDNYSGICFSLDDDMAGVQEMVFEALAGEALVGIASLDCRQAGSMTIKGGKALTVLPADAAESFATSRKFYFPVAAGSYKSGFRLSMKTASGTRIKEFPKLNTLTAGQVNDLGSISGVIEYKETRWDFDKDINGWYYYTHSGGQSSPHYRVENGYVRIWTDANTMQRNKLHTNAKNFGAGEYEYRLYVSEVAPGEKCSIGAFIYQDDKHELDFEIGYGSQSARKSCGAKEGEMVACMTNQGGPFNSTYTPISVGWHTCIIRLEVVGGKYKASWLIDGEVVKTLSLAFGPETKFLISVSVENLEFMGEKQPEHENYGLFDYVIYRQQIN